GGLYGISGIKTGDLRDIEAEMEKGNYRAKLAFNAFVYSVKRYIGEYLAILNGADCIVFTAGAGQNSVLLRRKITENMENLGIIIDEEKNRSNPKEGLISNDDSKIKVAVIPTNEEYIVASEVKNYLLSKANK
ncbi:MAG: acetate kinase, partial [Melioribacter sp.]|nr:acetate kinase [Melioribacter sp.]